MLNPKKRYGFKKIIKHPFIVKNLGLNNIIRDYKLTKSKKNKVKFDKNRNNEVSTISISDSSDNGSDDNVQ